MMPPVGRLHTIKTNAYPFCLVSTLFLFSHIQLIPPPSHLPPQSIVHHYAAPQTAFCRTLCIIQVATSYQSHIIAIQSDVTCILVSTMHAACRSWRDDERTLLTIFCTHLPFLPSIQPIFSLLAVFAPVQANAYSRLYYNTYIGHHLKPIALVSTRVSTPSGSLSKLHNTRTLAVSLCFLITQIRMDPFSHPSQGYSRRGSSSQDPNMRSLASHPSSPGAGGLPPPYLSQSGRSSSFGSSGGGLQRLPSPGDALRGPDRFEHSLDLPPLQSIHRSNSPILGRSGE